MSKTSLIDDGRIGSFSHRRECPEGQEFVESYRRKDGTFVKGFCRDIKDARSKGFDLNETEDGYHYYQAETRFGSSGGQPTAEEVRKSIEENNRGRARIVLKGHELYRVDNEDKKERLGTVTHDFVYSDEV